MGGDGQGGHCTVSFRAHSSCWAASGSIRVRQASLDSATQKRVPLAKGRECLWCSRNGANRDIGRTRSWPWEWRAEPSELSLQVPRGADSTLPAPCPSKAAPAIPDAARAQAGPWQPQLPPLAGDGPDPSPAPSGHLQKPPACPLRWSLRLGHGDGGLGQGGSSRGEEGRLFMLRPV